MTMGDVLWSVALALLALIATVVYIATDRIGLAVIHSLCFGYMFAEVASRVDEYRESRNK